MWTGIIRVTFINNSTSFLVTKLVLRINIPLYFATISGRIHLEWGKQDCFQLKRYVEIVLAREGTIGKKVIRSESNAFRFSHKVR